MKEHRNTLPVSPWDQIGPKMRPGLAQTDLYWGGFVVRNNPLGAVFDAIKSFCAPMPQQEQDGSDGYIAADASLSTPEYTTFDQGAGGYYDAGSLVFGPPASSLTPQASPCGTGTIWDAGLGQCVVPPMADDTPAATPKQKKQKEPKKKAGFGVKRRIRSDAAPKTATVYV
jgi:hypothetical protein